MQSLSMITQRPIYQSVKSSSVQFNKPCPVDVQPFMSCDNDTMKQVRPKWIQPEVSPTSWGLIGCNDSFN